MLEKIISFCQGLAAKFIASSKRFPVTILLSTAIAVILGVEQHMLSTLTEENRSLLQHLCMILGLAIPVSLSIKVFFERRPSLSNSKKYLIYGIAIGGLWLYYVFFLADLQIISWIRYTAVTISFYCMFLLIPYFYKKDNYELYIVHLVTRFFVTYLYSVILYAGLAAILEMIHVLFLITVSFEAYFDIGLIITGIFAPVFFLGDIPKQDKELSLSSYPKVLKVLLLYIIMPLVVAYSTTLYIYFAKILIQMEWPAGIVTNLVIWYSLLSITVMFAIYPLRHTSSWANKFIKVFPIVVLPLLAMMFLSLGMRVNAYGITENRYFVFLTGLWLVSSMIYYITHKTPRNIVLPISLAILSLLSVMGPWSCFSVSTTSQSMRLEKIISKYDVIENGKISKINPDITADDKKEITNILYYFNSYHKLDEVKILPQNFKIGELKTVFGFSPTDNNGLNGNSTKYFNHVMKEQEKVASIKGFDYLFELSTINSQIEKPEIPISVVCTGKDSEVKILENGQVIYAKKINDIAQKIHTANQTNSVRKTEDMMVTDENENVKVIYFVKSISGTDDEGVINTQSLDCSLLVKMKNH